MIENAFLDYYRCPDRFADFRLADGLPDVARPGYFHLGPDLICFGAAGNHGRENAADPLSDVFAQVRIEGSTCLLPFNPSEIANNLRYERYLDGRRPSALKQLTREIYYGLRPVLPVSIRRHLQRAWLRGCLTRPFPRWPVDRTVDQMFEMLMRLRLQVSDGARVPFIWFWPEGKSSCAIVTHDVETGSGLAFAPELMDMNDSFGIKASFQMIPAARYVVTEDALSAIRERGCEINVHDLKHDGHLFDDHEEFLRSAARINESALRFGSSGFRSGALYRNVRWYRAFGFSYDMSVPNVGHLDPQPGGCCTVMPYFIDDILELPVTTTQDYSLFHILGTYSLELWREQIRLIMEQHGLISFIVHPDYLDTAEARKAYLGLLKYLSALRTEADVWTALPGQVNIWWRQRRNMRLVSDGKGWRVEGPGAEAARVAFATLDNDKVSYVVN